MLAELEDGNVEPEPVDLLHPLQKAFGGGWLSPGCRNSGALRRDTERTAPGSSGLLASARFDVLPMEGV